MATRMERKRVYVAPIDIRGTRARACTQNSGNPHTKANAPFSLLMVSNITKRFGGITAVDNVSFRVDKGDVIGIIGPNGAGKTTLFNVITGVLAPDSGSVLLEGLNVTGFKPYKLVQLGVGRTFQVPRIFREMGVLENMLVSTISGKTKREDIIKKAKSMLEIVGLENLLYAPAVELSVGQQKLLEIMMTLMLDIKILFLDEPFAGVNPGIKMKIINVLKDFRERGGTVLIISHDLPSIMEQCEKVFVLNQGKIIAQGAPMEVVEYPEVIEAYVGV